jgi:hypothetical protein
VKEETSLPKGEIFEKSNTLRINFENYNEFWKAGGTGVNDVDQNMTAKPLLLSSSYSEI